MMILESETYRQTGSLSDSLTGLLFPKMLSQLKRVHLLGPRPSVGIRDHYSLGQWMETGE